MALISNYGENGQEDEMLLEWKKQLLHDKEISHAKQNLQQLSQVSFPEDFLLATTVCSCPFKSWELSLHLWNLIELLDPLFRSCKCTIWKARSFQHWICGVSISLRPVRLIANYYMVMRFHFILFHDAQWHNVNLICFCWLRAQTLWHGELRFGRSLKHAILVYLWCCLFTPPFFSSL